MSTSTGRGTVWAWRWSCSWFKICLSLNLASSFTTSSHMKVDWVGKSTLILILNWISRTATAWRWSRLKRCLTICKICSYLVCDELFGEKLNKIYVESIMIDFFFPFLSHSYFLIKSSWHIRYYILHNIETRASLEGPKRLKRNVNWIIILAKGLKSSFKAKQTWE